MGFNLGFKELTSTDNGQSLPISFKVKVTRVEEIFPQKFHPTEGFF